MLLFKYLHKRFDDEVKLVIDTFKIRFTPFLEMNDPFEAFFVLEPVDRELEAAKEDNYLAETILAKTELEFYNRYLGLLSLLASYWNLLMWAHYASDHEGYVIGINSESPFFRSQVIVPGRTYHHPRVIERSGFGSLREVKYQDIRHSIKLGDDFLDAFFIKSNHWQYECEWRIFKDLEGADDKSKPGIHLYNLPPEAIEVVIMGARAGKQLQDKIKQCLSRKECKHIKLFQAKLHPNRYELEYEHVTLQ